MERRTRLDIFLERRVLPFLTFWFVVMIGYQAWRYFRP